MDKKEISYIMDGLSELKYDTTNGMDEFNFVLNNQTVKFIKNKVSYIILINGIPLFVKGICFFEIKRVLNDLEEITKWIERYNEEVK